MPDIEKGHTFVDGGTVNAASLNNLVDLSTILNTFISEKDPTTVPAPDTDDYLLLWDSDGEVLKKTRFQGGVSSVGLTMPTGEFAVTGSPVTSSGVIAVAKQPQLPHRVFAGPATGTGTGIPTFRALVPADTATVVTPIGSDNVVNWLLSNTFYKVISAATTFSFSNAAEGQVIRCFITASDASAPASWPSGIYWRGGIHPTQTQPGGDMWTFQLQGGYYLGYADQNFRV